MLWHAVTVLQHKPCDKCKHRMSASATQRHCKHPWLQNLPYCPLCWTRTRTKHTKLVQLGSHIFDLKIGFFFNFYPWFVHVHFVSLKKVPQSTAVSPTVRNLSLLCVFFFFCSFPWQQHSQTWNSVRTVRSEGDGYCAETSFPSLSEKGAVHSNRRGVSAHTAARRQVCSIWASYDLPLPFQ
jgi:hypothetical protein